MASLRIKFPEKEESSLIALQGKRITVGRRADNTVQILDRLISAHHAELVEEEGGHYRLHDLDSTNGTFVNGEQITDYHLRDNCQISFGAVQCEFSTGSEETATEEVPSAAQVQRLRQENSQLSGRIGMLTQELEALKKIGPRNDQGAELGVSKEEYERVVAERHEAQERLSERDAQLAQLKGDLAVLRKDRENLQKANESARAELDRLRSGSASPQAAAGPAPASGGASAVVPGAAHPDRRPAEPSRVS